MQYKFYVVIPSCLADKDKSTFRLVHCTCNDLQLVGSMNVEPTEGQLYFSIEQPGLFNTTPPETKTSSV